MWKEAAVECLNVQAFAGMYWDKALYTQLR